MEDAPRNQYLKDNLTYDQERALIRRAQAGDDDARNKLVENFMPYVVGFCKRYSFGKGFSRRDLAQEGALGLMRAVDKFDFQYTNRFRTYAHWWIQQYVARYAKKFKYAVNLPVNLEVKEEFKQGVPTLGNFESDLERNEEITQAQTVDNADELQFWLDKAKKWCTPRQHQVIEMRACGLTLDDVGTILEITRERVRQIQNNALHKIRMHAND